MKKLYAFLIALVALGVITSGVVQAQSYTSTSYIVHKVDVPDAAGLGSGPNWSPVSGTNDASGELAYYAPYEEGIFCGAAHALPFNFRIGNASLVAGTNSWSFTCEGSVILSPTWPNPIQDFEEPLDGFYDPIEYEPTSPTTSQYNYAYPYMMGQNEYDDAPYLGEFPNYCLMAFSEGSLSYNYIPSESSNPTKFQYAVLGSAPNRELVCETDNMHTGYDFEYGYNTYRSFQTVIYESGISSFQFNYGPTVGGNPFGYDRAYEGAPITVNGYTWPGAWGYAYSYNEGSYALIEDYGAMCGVKFTAGNYILIDYNANGSNVNNNFVVAYNTPYGPTGLPLFPDTAVQLPQSSIRIAVAYPYDFTANTISFPASEQTYGLASPYGSGSPLTPTATITNAGSSVPTSLQVSFTITQVGVGQVYNQVETLTTLPGAFSQQTITFPPFSPGVSSPLSQGNQGYGIYEDTMIVYNLQPTADENPGDNESTNEWISSPPNDIKAVQVLNPPTGFGTQIDVATPISIRFRNLGSANQTNVPLTATVHDSHGNVVFRDTVIIPNWPATPTGGNSDGSQDFSTSGSGPGKGAYYDTAFPYNAAWVPSTLGMDTVFGIAILGDDQLRLDDTTKSVTAILPEYDAQAISVVNPQPGQEEAFATSWPPEGLFKDVGVVDLFQVRLVDQIRQCSDGALVFQSDTTEQALNVDEGQVRFYFPTDEGVYHISAIPPGCYNLCVIAEDANDIDFANDTACEQFSIVDRLKGDYYVGVGRQFQSIHQAVDTMRFRGIGANVRLILTDSAYYENGTYDVSSPQGNIDLRNISGLHDTSTVTWIPYPGQTPHIYFTGPQPFGFYMGDKFPGYMKWEGYNPSTVPSPDLLVPEPAKRSLTISSSGPNNGAVFGIEEGASNISMKDLIIHGNAGFASDSSAAIRIYNEHSFLIFSGGIGDTVPMNHIVVNNCEIGNAKYGIYDHGFHDAYDPVLPGYRSWRNHDNVFTRNTIGTMANPLSYAGIQFNSENGIVISHNEVSNVNATVIPKGGGTGQNVFGIVQPDMNTYIGPPTLGAAPAWSGDTGNVVGAWIDANRVRNMTSLTGNTYGIAVQQSSWVYTSSGLTAVTSVLPAVTKNRITNNMILDLWTASGNAYPILMTTASRSYSTDLDSVFNNSISTTNAAANIVIRHQKHAFLWDNIIQNTGNGPYTNYILEVPRPYASAISSDYNLFDLHGTNNFDSVIEYDVRYGTIFQHTFFRRLNDWRTYVGQDMHSLTGNPLFATPAMGTDSLHMPPALTYIESPAANTGEWLGTGTQSKDFDGNPRLSQNGVVDIGAQEWDAFQYTNDLAVMEITQPAGFSQTSDTSIVTTASPLWITAIVKNLSSVGVYNEPVKAIVQRSVGGVWTTVTTLTSAPLNWQVDEAKSVTFQGPALTAPNSTGIFQVIVSVPNDQNNANNSASKAFQILLKQNAVIVSYNGANSQGIQNLDSVEVALNRLGVPFDTIDRNSPKGLPNTTIIDYTPWWTLVWAMGDPGVAPVSGQPTGQAAPTLQETDEITRYLNAGLTYAKKSMVIAGQNTAYYSSLGLNNPVTDTQWLQTTMHTRFVLNSPGGSWNGLVVGQQPAYWTYSDSLSIPTNPNNCEECGTPNLNAFLSPDVIMPSTSTPAVGPIVNGYAYTYGAYPTEGAGVSYYNPTINTVFYGFDWSNPHQTKPADTLQNDLTSGTTRTLAAAFAFFRGHAGTILPINSIVANVQRTNGNAFISWNVVGQNNVAHYNVEQQNQNSWTTLPNPVAAIDNQTGYSYTQTGIDPTQSYTYRVAAVDESGAETYSNTVELGPDASEIGFTLGQSYPNPSQGVTEISFTLPEASQVSLRVIDVTGKIVNTDVTNVPYAAGSQSVKLDLSSLPSGSYLYEMIATGADGRSSTLSNKLTIEKN